MNSDPLNLESIESLKDVKGVGKKTEKKLKKYFPSEESALKRIKKGEILEISKAPGISLGDAARIIRKNIESEYGSENILETDSLKKIYKNLLKKLKKRAKTDYGEARLNMYFPTSSEERIEEVRDWVEEILNMEIKGDLNNLENVNPLKEGSRPDIFDRIIITDNYEVSEKIQEKTVGMQVEVIQNLREIRQYLEDYQTVFLVSEELNEMGLESEKINHLKPPLEEVEKICPEKIISYFSKNIESIKSSLKIHKKTKTTLKEEIPKEKISELENLLKKINSKGKLKHEGKLERLKKISEKLPEIINKQQEKANKKLEKLVKKKEIKIEGNEIANLLKDRKKAEELVKSELSDDYKQIIEDITQELIEELELKNEEKSLAKELFPSDLKIPLKPDEEIKKSLIQKIDNKISQQSLESKKEFAKKLKKHKETAEKIVEQALEIDTLYAIKKFSEDHKMKMAEITDKRTKIIKGRNLSIQNPEPIDYKIEEVRLLTGVNSGGKTSALDLIAQFYILTMMGLPVPAKNAKIRPVEKIYYYRDIKKTMSTGALEQILIRFNNLLSSEKTKLVLIDELENITEPGASAKIVSGILDMLKEEDNIAIFVSHLADKIIEKSEKNIPVDGIQPEGLDENLNLKVDRTPKRNVLAMSTPELIVEKLSKQNKSEFYNKLSEKFKSENK